MAKSSWILELVLTLKLEKWSSSCSNPEPSCSRVAGVECIESEDKVVTFDGAGKELVLKRRSKVSQCKARNRMAV